MGGLFSNKPGNVFPQQRLSSAVFPPHVNNATKTDHECLDTNSEAEAVRGRFGEGGEERAGGWGVARLWSTRWSIFVQKVFGLLNESGCSRLERY